MKSISWLVPIAVLVATAARAEPMNDAAYCKALSEKYETYLSPKLGGGPMTDSADGMVAVEQCKAGNTATAIPVLEKRLRNAKIDLPSRG